MHTSNHPQDAQAHQRKSARCNYSHPHDPDGNSPDQQGHGEGSSHSSHEPLFRKKFWRSLLLSVPVIIFSENVQSWLNYTAPQFPGSEWIVPLFSVVIFMVGGIPFIKMAIPELKKNKPGMMSLISLAISVAFVYSLGTTLFNFGASFYWELVTLIDVMLLGHWMEMRSIRQASSALDELAKLMPDMAEIIREDGSIEEVKIAHLKEGHVIMVRPGASIAADGTVIEGSSSIDESMITGESKPVTRTSGDPVIAGTINQEGSLQVRVDAVGENTALAGIMRLVKEARESKSDTQLLADKAAGWLFYTALAVAALSAVAWSIARGFDIEVLKRVVTILVTACPHALGLAIPLVIAIATAKGAANGILIRDQRALEALRELDGIVFDKTGTLTEGKFGVVDMVAADGWKAEKALGIAAAAESNSEHLIAASIRRKASAMNLKLPPAKDFQALKGKGVQSMVAGRRVYVGGPRLLMELDLDLPPALSDLQEKSAQKGHSVIFLIDTNKPVAAFALADAIRPESHSAVQQLQARGLEVVMITGDSREVAQKVADELGIERFFAEVLPQDKDQSIRDLQKEGKKIAMVGDGVNDAPALARADVGIAIGSGTDVAVESAGLILVKNNPLDVVRAITLSQATYKKMVQNLVWAMAYNLIALPIAAGVLAPWGILLSPAVGALFMSLSTVIVAINAQFLRNVQLAE